MLTQEILVILGVLRCILRHTEKHTELLEKSLIIIISLLAELLEHWKTSPPARVYSSIIYAYTIVLVCMHKPMHACPMHARKADSSCDSMHY